MEGIMAHAPEDPVRAENESEDDFNARGSNPRVYHRQKYLRKMESQFIGSSKVYASTFIKRLVTMKYTGGGIREHILRMSNMASKLKPMDMELKDEFIVHLIFASLPEEFEAFAVNYNSQLEKWGIEKMIAMCVQEEERLKGSHGDSINYLNQNKKRNYQNNNSKPQGKS
ncbi:uncharacterized protein LOC105914180 [Setaria italica]|uniref:uncharacterized protein LOC105914180 n=1 Tax=Setaria italica TaxID=4555 RepID=UPI000646B31C|nr:uncharacterized protein LOC105914180 [Setaria italica]